MSKDALVSARAVRECIDTIEGEVASQRRLRAEGDPFFRHCAWILEEMRAGLREAEREFRPTGEVADLTGWSEETLRRHAKALYEGGGAPAGWAAMLVRRDGGDWSFCLSTVPIKRSVAA